MRVLVAAWGLPTWKKVNYCVEDTKTESSSSTLALIDKYKPDKTIIVLSLSLFARYVNKLSALVNNKTVKYCDLEKKLRNLVLNDNSYGAIVEIKDRIEKGEIEMVFAPGVGKFSLGSQSQPKVLTLVENYWPPTRNKVNAESQGGQTGTRGINLYFIEVYRRVSEAIRDSEDKLELYVDLTHGVNYMPYLTTEAVRLAAMANAKKGVSIKVFNSDPVLVDNTLTNECYQINLVNSVNIESNYAFNQIMREVLVRDSDRFKKSVNVSCLGDFKVLKSADELKRLARAANGGIFVLINHLACEIDRMLKEIDRRLDISNIDVSVTQNGDEIRLEYNATSVCEKDNLSIQRILSIHSELAYVHAMLKALSKINAPEVTLELLDKWADEYGDTTTSVIIKDEVDKMSEVSYLKDLLNNIMKSQDKRGKADMRNMLAHGGLEKNVIYIKIKGEDGKEIEDINKLGKEAGKINKGDVTVSYCPDGTEGSDECYDSLSSILKEF
ncbi:CRISPR-associated CARF protein Csx1 [Metallosphaera cuprina]|uniref:CRISPR-associated protein, MJ1666 family n=1 Tax=Metallosphaera cuprina (strain Ar-4) TaxID=1006006 RepID=F4G2V9_METCR|nr:CRISPR-associated CARF protein Csx1 [Metallosphaera cuprina]AEB95157.1 CRISPR-associated protein, MJ1666 family [Metallosphaera cuprina Ar-4]